MVAIAPSWQRVDPFSAKHAIFATAGTNSSSEQCRIQPFKDRHDTGNNIRIFVSNCINVAEVGTKKRTKTPTTFFVTVAMVRLNT
jgi:hypothetical protein